MKKILIAAAILFIGIAAFALTANIIVLVAAAVAAWSYIKNEENAKTNSGAHTNQTETKSQNKAEDTQKMQHQTDEDGEKSFYTAEQASAIMKKLKEMSAKESVRIKATPIADDESAFEKRAIGSRFGGLPYWTRGEDFPTGEDGKPLYLLAQINFSDVPPISDYPARGLLQIFVRADNMWGCDFNSEQKNWRIIWRDVLKASVAMSAAELHEIGVKSAAEVDEETGEFPLPLQKEFSLAFEKTTTFIHPNCDDFENAVKHAAEALGFATCEKSAYDLFDEDSFNAFFDDTDVLHQIGGYPNFTQNDARRDGDMLLLQIDSQLSTDKNGRILSDEILWGDVGIANFFISRDDLTARNFTNVLYNWDCF